MMVVMLHVATFTRKVEMWVEDERWVVHRLTHAHQRYNDKMWLATGDEDRVEPPAGHSNTTAM